jgi:hypothetical protein
MEGEMPDIEEPPADLDNLGDEFGGAEEEEPLGRSKKMESRRLQRKILEMKRLIKQAEALRESKKRSA